MKKNITNLLLLSFLCMVVFLSCGKVVQVTNSQEKKPPFSVSFSIKAPLESNQHPSKNTASLFTVTHNTTIYGQVIGLKGTNVFDELSWGKAAAIKEITKKTIPPKKSSKKNQKTKPPEKPKEKITINFNSEAHNKQGETIKKADYMWLYLTYKEKSGEWQGKGDKIKRDYPLYLVQLFSNKDQYQMKVTDEVVVSENKSISLNDITPYDTFLAAMVLIGRENKPEGMNNIDLFRNIKHLYNQKFFETLKYKFPKNQAKIFDENQPRFVFDSNLEIELLEILDITNSGNKREAINYVKELRKSLFSDETYKILIKNIKKYSAFEKTIK